MARAVQSVMWGAALAAAAWSAPSAPADPGSVSAPVRLEFQLPLPGEAIPAEGGGVLVQVDSTVEQVLFKWYGPDSGSADGKVQFEGFFQAQVPPLKPGRWTLVAMGFDAQGRMNARRSLGFEVGQVVPAAAAPESRVSQELFVSLQSGLNFGVAENQLRWYRSLQLGSDGKSVPGQKMTPLDQVFSGNALLVYRLQQGAFGLKTRISTDATETWSHTPSPSRFGLDLRWSDWAEVHLGDQYPQWSPLLIDGSRIRGAGAGLAVGSQSVRMRLDVAVGTLRPAVRPQIRAWTDYVDTIPAQFARVVEAAHLGLELGNTAVHLAGFHAKDRIGETDMRLHDSLDGQAPRENLGVAADLAQRWWDNRLEFFGSAALALTTDDRREGNFLDSLRHAQDLPIPGFVSDIFPANLSTRGVELLTQDAPRLDLFLWENAALRGGVRSVLPLGGSSRLRLELRGVHVGALHESFAKTYTEAARTGLEWSATTATWRDALLLVVSGAEVQEHPAVGSDIPSHSVNASLAWTPVATPVGWSLRSGRLATGGGATSRSESWNAGGGLFGMLGSRAGAPIHWRANYGFFENAARIPVTLFDSSSALSVDSQFSMRAYRSLVRTHTFDASLRWRPVRDLEARTGYLLASQGIPTDTLRSDQTRTHRIQAGFTMWLLSHQIEVALDGSQVLRPDQTGAQERGWDQSLRLSWECGASQTVRLAERWGRPTGTRTDLRLEAGWEAWF